jgi:hypothetical protein
VLPNAAGAGAGTDALMVMVGGAGAPWDILDFFLLEVMGWIGGLAVDRRLLCDETEEGGVWDRW